jgi:superfamily II DNA or RNA helicase
MFCPPNKIDLVGIKKTAGDYNLGDLANRTNRREVTGDALLHYQQHKGQFVVFCVSRQHAADVAQVFQGAGIACENIDGSMSRDKRRGIISALRSGNLTGVTSCDLISEGFDLPAITVAILLRPTISLIVYIQQTGRALRPEPGKTAIILDHAGNCMRHGLPDQDRQWTLEGLKKEKKTGIKIRQCKKCFAVYPAGNAVCPMCGAGGVAQQRLLKIVNGQLTEITPEMIARSRISAISYKEAWAECQTPGDVFRMAKAKGYRPAWAIRAVMHISKVDKYTAAEMLGYNRYAAKYVNA